MSTQALDLPVVAGGALRSANFFNGRLLTGDDLRREQDAHQARLRRLGRAIGDGVAYGLEVTETTGTSTNSRPVVTVAAGLALCRSGQTVELSAAIDLGLARSAPTATSEPGALFADCQPFAPGTYTAGAGVYLLTIAPAQQGEGRAPVSGLTNEPAPCNVALSVEAVRFRLIRLALPAADLADKAHLRNRVAYRFFAPEAQASFLRDPFGAAPGPTLLDTLRDQTLHDDEVPLAVVGWSVDDGIQFVDRWAVRRRPAGAPGEAAFAGLVGDRAAAEGAARFLQFQEQIADRRLAGGTAAVRASDEFERLPACGFLPLRTSSRPGFDSARFFEGLPRRVQSVFVLDARIPSLVHEAAAYPPIDVSRRELIWLYLCPANNRTGTAVQPYVLFVSGAVPYAADARYDSSRWDFANYSLPT
jgi:hypothetical protein